MRNRYAGLCQLCGIKIEAKKGRWREGGFTAKRTQNFSGLRCMGCSTTTKKGLKLTEQKLLKKILHPNKGIWNIPDNF